MKTIFSIINVLSLVLGFSSFVFSQTCPDGTPNAVKYNSSGKLVLKWSDPEGGLTMYNALDATPHATAIALTPGGDFTKGDMRDPSPGDHSKLATTSPAGGSGNYTGTINFNLVGGGMVGPCIYVAGNLPIVLTEFNAIKRRDKIMISWKTESELNNDFIAVERSSDGRKFTEIGRLLGSGTSYDVQSYHLEDKAPLLGMNYYRLRQVDFDGTTTFSKIVSIAFNDVAKDKLLAYPTVLENGQKLSIDLSEGQGDIIQLEVFNTNGQLVRSYYVQGEGKSSILISSFAEGMYFIKTNGLYTNLKARFFVKNN